MTRLAWEDSPLGSIDLPRRQMLVRAGFGSGLAVRPGDPPGTLWAVGDRGPNLKVETAQERFGLEGLESLARTPGVKIMPRPDLGPALAELRVWADRVELVRTIRLSGASGRALPGLPVPPGDQLRYESAFSLEGVALPADPSGADSEGVAALSDGSFWVGDEYGPSLLKVDREGRVVVRLVPQGTEEQWHGADFPVQPVLPAIACRRQLNRGFEALAVSADERSLYLAFQSPLAHPDEDAHRKARHARLWRLDASSGEVLTQFLYPLDPPGSFRRDWARGGFGFEDIKIGEMTSGGADTLLVLERGSLTSKIYQVPLAHAEPIPREHIDLATRPTLEELSASGALDLPVLPKKLLFSSDDAPQVAADIEGMALLSDRELLLVSDNDFGVEGAETSFWRIRFDAPFGRG